MKAAARRWAEEVPIKSGPKVVLQALVGHLDMQTGRCFPSVRTLVRKTALAESTVRAALRDLEAHGLISTTARRKDGKQTSNDYHLHVGAKPKPIGKRRDALRKARQRTSQTPMSGGWDDVSSHRNTAAGQPPDTGPEYGTGRGGEDGQGRRGQPGEGLAGDEHSDFPLTATREQGSECHPLDAPTGLTVSKLAAHAAGADGAVHSEVGEGELTPWLKAGGALSGVEALSAGRETEEPLPETASFGVEASDQPTLPEAEIVADPRGENPPWSLADWRAYFDERAGIAEYDGGLSRTEAEAQAFEDCVNEWNGQHAMLSSTGGCSPCSGSDRSGDPPIPVSGGLAWMDQRGQEPWRTGRRAAAVAALGAMGIAGSAPAEMSPHDGRNEAA